MDHSKKSTYLFSLDALRAVAIIAVVAIHQTTTTLQVLNHNVGVAYFSLYLNQASRFAVPLFFLISGFVLELNYKGGFSYSTYLKKRASRILIPYLTWSLLYYSISHEFRFSNFLSWNFLLNLLNGTSSYHLYFIPTLIIFYLLFPFLHKSIRLIKRPFFLFFIFIIQILIAFYDYYFHKINLQEDLRVALLVFCFFIFGMSSSHYKTSILDFVKKYFKFISVLTFIILLTICHEVIKLTINLKTTAFIYNQYGPLNYLYTIFISCGLFYFFERITKFKQFIKTLSSLSLFVFFIHVLILQFIWINIILKFNSFFNSSMLTQIWFDPLVLIVTCSLSFLIAFIISKIPYATKITG